MTDAPTERDANGAWAKLRRRKAVQWGLAYAAGYAQLGMADEAFKWLDRALRERDEDVLEICAGPLFQSLRRDPRYVPLLQRVGLSDEQVAALDFDVEFP